MQFAVVACILAVLLLIAVALFAIVIVFAKRLLQLDELFHALVDDVRINIDYLKKLAETPLFENSQEVRTAHRNMSIIAARLNEFSIRMKEQTNARDKHI
jgi:hypothetical protein